MKYLLLYLERHL